MLSINMLPILDPPAKEMIMHSTVKVLHVIYSLYRGGAERLIEAIVANADRDRFEHAVCALTGGDDLAGSIRAAGAGVTLMHKRRRGDLTAIPGLIAIARRERARLLHLHNSPGGFWGTLAAAFGRLGVPIVRTEHRPYLPESLPGLYRILSPLLYRRAAGIVCVSEDVRRSIAAAFPGIEARCHTIYNGIDMALFSDLPAKIECRRRFKLPAEGRLVGTVGRLVAVKNHALLLRAFASVTKKAPDAHLAIAGEGELRNRLVALAADLGLSDSVSFLPATPDIAQFYGALDCFVLSSASEGLPLTLLEAMAAGVPCVCTCVGGIPEVIEDGRSGFVVPKGSAEALSDRIAGVLLDPDAAVGPAKRGRSTIRERFTIAGCVAETERLYTEVLGGTQPGS